ncbi:MAG: hypothetical protein NTV79_11990, partial [Candidatus Aureabacteria bacterium]|nr:hypothetical protein [Candidatus Auribacterota bacterium]
LGSFSLGVFRGQAALGALRIAQPPGFGEEVLLSLPRMGVTVKPASLLSPPLVVEEVVLEDMEVNIVRNADGVLNTDALVPKGKAPPAPPQRETKAPKPVLVKSVEIKNLSFSFTDRAIGKVPESDSAAPVPRSQTAPGLDKVLVVRVKDFNLLLENLLIDPSADPSAVAPALLTITARIVQAPLPDGLLGVFVRMGPVGKGVPPLNGALRLAGLELGPLDAVVPPGTAQKLGGDALDLTADFSVAPDLLDCLVKVDTSGGQSFSLPIAGTQDKPQFDTSSILFVALSRIGGGVGALVGNAAGAGAAVAGAAAESALAVGEGAGGVVGSVGGGLLDTVTSIATGDLKGAGQGLTKATVGSATKVVETVGTAGRKMVKGTGQAVETGLGDAKAKEWRAATKERWSAEWKKAQESVSARPFPPVGEK